MNYKFMLLAYEQAQIAYSIDEVPVGAVIVKNGEVIGRGYNRKKLENCVVEHAEIIAIREASSKIKNWRLNGCDIYITVEPCPMCASAIKQARISNIYFGTRNNDKNNINIVRQILCKDNTNNVVHIYGGYFNFKTKKIMNSFFSDKR